MALMTFDEYNTKFPEQATSYQVKGFSVHSDLVAGMLTNKTEEKLGTVADVLLNPTGQIEYIVVSLDDLALGRQVLLGADRARIDHDHQVVYAGAMSRDEAKALPEFHPEMLK